MLRFLDNASLLLYNVYNAPMLFLYIFSLFSMPGFRRLKVLRNKNTTPVSFVEFYDVITAMQARQLLNG